jgi:hypothetical protein
MLGSKRQITEALSRDVRGFEVCVGRPRRETQRIRVEWSAVQSASAFKRDLVIHDLVCILFRLRNGRQIEVDEQMSGWPEFVENLPTSSLPGVRPFSEWAEQVVMPPFATNETLLYSAP